MTTTRMFDYPATPNERAVTRRNNERHQMAMFDTDPTPPHGIPRPCPVCAGDHTEHDCPHGTAPELPVETPATRNPSNPAQVRAMFKSLGWSVTE